MRCLLVLLILPSVIFSNYVIVPDAFITIQEAIYNVGEGDSIVVREGTYTENINLSGATVTIGSLRLIDAGPSLRNSTIISGGELGPVINFTNSHLTIFDLTIQDGHNQYGAGLTCSWSGGYAKVENCIIKDNIATDEGGGIGIWGSTGVLEITNSIIYNNYAGLSGGGLMINGGPQVEINHCLIYQNTSEINGGALCLWESISSLSLTNSIIWGNSANQTFHFYENSANSSYCLMDEILPGESNFSEYPYIQVKIDSGPIVQEFSPAIGAGISSDLIYDINGDPRPNPIGTSPDIGPFEHEFDAPEEYDGRKYFVSNEGVDIDDNGTEDFPFESIQFAIDLSLPGDSVIVKDGLYLENIDFHTNLIYVGSYFALDGNRDHIMNTVIDGQRNGVVVKMENQSRDAKLEGMTITNGEDDALGGGIYIHDGSPVVANCIISNNIGYDGGGLFLHGNWESVYSPLILNCEIVDNVSTQWDGGGIQMWRQMHAEIVNCIIARNTTHLYGGGLSTHSNSNAKIINCTIVDNFAEQGGGGYNNNNSTTQITNCIIWDNESGSGIGSETSRISGQVLIQNSTISTWGAGGNIELPDEGTNYHFNPMLQDITANDYSLNPGSFCIGAGIETVYAMEDSRNQIRPTPDGSNPDIGALESELASRIGPEPVALLTSGSVEAGVSYLGDDELYIPSSNDRVYRFNTDGEIQYQIQVNGDVKSATTLASDHTLYIASTDFNLYAFNSNGVSLNNWPVSLGSEATASVALYDELAFIGTSNGILQAIDATGQIVWNYNAGEAIYSSAAIDSEGNIFFITESGKLISFNLQTANDIPTIPWFEFEIGSPVTSSPAVDNDGHLYVTTLAGELLRYSVQVDNISLDWAFQASGPISASPVLDPEGFIYFGSEDSLIYSVDTEGGLNWSVQTDGMVRGTGTLRLAENGDHLFLSGSDDGNLYGISTFSGEVLWVEYAYSPISCSILVQDGVVYYGTIDGRVYGVNIPILSLSKSASSNSISECWNTFQGNNSRTGKLGTAISIPAMSNVHPGDADNDGDVDAEDILPLGVYFLEQGNSRSSATMGWSSQEVTSWESYPANFADCNGDGVVDEKDIIAIGVNWGQTHSNGLVNFRIDPSDHDRLDRHRDSFERLYSAIESNSSSSGISMKRILGEVLGLSPSEYLLYQNYPNPFNPSTEIQFSLPERTQVNLTVYNLRGERIADLIRNASMPGGYHTVNFGGSEFSSGIYFYELMTSDFHAVKKMLLVK